jgi:propanediol dehydratase large subunit
MSNCLIRVSFEVVTPESAEIGEASERGWEDETGTVYTFREAVKLLRGMEPSSTSYHKGVWYLRTEQDFRDSSDTTYSYHIIASSRFQRRLYQAVTGKMIGIFHETQVGQ